MYLQEDSSQIRNKTEIDGMEEGTAEYNEAVAELDEMEADLAEACEYTTCVEKNAGNSDGASSESGLDLTVVLIVLVSSSLHYLLD